MPSVQDDLLAADNSPLAERCAAMITFDLWSVPLSLLSLGSQDLNIAQLVPAGKSGEEGGGG